MSVSVEIGHEKFLSLIQDKAFKDIMKKRTPVTREEIERKLNDSIASIDAINKEYLKWIIEQSRSNFYLLTANNDMCLIKRNFKGMVVIGFKVPGAGVKHLYESHNFVIEIVNIHSAQKGEGFKMMKRVIELHRKLKIPISLWTETEKNVEYFECYGFKNMGRIGNNGEFLMILKYIEY